MAAVLNIADLVGRDNPADYRVLPVIIRSNQCSAPLVQFQSGISQGIGNSKLREFGANRTNDYSLWPTSLNNKTTNHHVLTRLNKATGTDVAKRRTRARTQIINFDQGNSNGVVYTTHDGGVVARLQVCNNC